jgi:hypothetical protein
VGGLLIAVFFPCTFANAVFEVVADDEVELFSAHDKFGYAGQLCHPLLHLLNPPHYNRNLILFAIKISF